MTREVVVEQLLIGWSRTSNGKNVLARSPGWPGEPSRSAWVAALGKFLHPATDRMVRETGEVPWLLEFLPGEQGSILMAKAYAADSLRAGEFQVHALLDASRTLGPQHLPALAAAGVLLTERPEDVTRLETLRVEVPPVPAVGATRPVALALQFLHRGGPLLVRAEALSAGVAVLGELAAALPATVAARTPARSVVTDAAEAQGIAVTVPPWTRGAERVPTMADIEVGDGYLKLAERLLAGEWAVPEDAEDLSGLLDLLLLDPETVTGEDLARGVTGRRSGQWVAEALATARTRDLLLDQVRVGRVPWSAWTDDVWLRWFDSDSRLWPGLRATIDSDGFAANLARVIDRLPRSALDQTMAQLSRWPAERLGVLIDALVLSENSPPELLIQVLDRLPGDEVRRVVQRHWPALGRQLGLPASVVQALRPNRNWLGW